VNDTGEPAVVWCHLNDEGNTLAKTIPDSRQVSGSDAMEDKEDAFLSFSHGQTRVLVIKPKIGAFGLNWQHCAHMTFFPSHSYEQYYQAVRRCWRFGQTRPVTVDLITTSGSADVLANQRRKAEQAATMFSALVAHMNDALSLARTGEFTRSVEVPSWLSQTK
jgi:SNF2 family DNA or RNA helicase